MPAAFKTSIPLSMPLSISLSVISESAGKRSAASGAELSASSKQ